MTETRQEDRQEVQMRTVRVGRRTWQVRTTWAGRGTRRVRIVRTERRRIGWTAGRWREGHGQVWGEVVSETWS